jgi:hypothetical protein
VETLPTVIWVGVTPTSDAVLPAVLAVVAVVAPEVPPAAVVAVVALFLLLEQATATNRTAMPTATSFRVFST